MLTKSTDGRFNVLKNHENTLKKYFKICNKNGAIYKRGSDPIIPSADLGLLEIIETTLSA